MSSKIGIVIRREFFERVSKKSFIISTLLMPILMLGLMVAPALIAAFSQPEKRIIAVVDDSGIIASSLNNDDNVEYVIMDQPIDSVLKKTDIDGVLHINKDIMTSKSGSVAFYSNEASSMQIETGITSQIEQTIENERLKNYNIEDLDEILNSIKANVSMQTFRLDEENNSSASSSFLSYIIGVIMTLILYLFLLLYGQMVMTSIIEEKNNRVLEIVVSSIKPAQLMMGKIIGIGSVAVVQVLIWAVMLVVISGVLLPMLIPTEIMGDIAASNAGTLNAENAVTDIEMIHALATLSNVGYILKIFSFLLVFLIGGFLFYSSLYAAIGSSVDNIQDAGQFQSIVVFPILIGFVLAMSIANDPNSTIATVMSIIPFTSPMVMIARIPFGIATWEIITSLVILYASFILLVQLSAKIYRVGIFMYGKKPSIKEIIKWINYK